MHGSIQSTDLERRVRALLEEAYELQGKEAARKAQEAVALADEAPEESQVLSGCRAYASFLALRSGNRLEEAFHVGHAALVPLQECGDTQWYCRMLTELGSNLGRRGRCEEAQSILEQGLEQSRENGYPELEARTLRLLGNTHDMLGDPAKALDLTLQARVIHRRLGDRDGEASALASAGPLYRILGAYPEALVTLKGAIALLKDDEASDTRAAAQMHLAVVYVVVGLHNEALECAQSARKAAPPGSPAAVYALNTLVYAYGEAGRHDEALEVGERALLEARALERDHLIADVLLHIGDVLVPADRLDEAESRYREALELSAGMDDMQVIAGCKVGLARVLEGLGEIDQAFALVDPLIEAWEGYGERHTLVEIHELLSRLSEARGDRDRALTHLQRASAIRADLFSRETDVRLHNLQVSAELRRERERSADALHELSGRVMQSQEEERRRVARDLHDDLGQQLALLAVEIDLMAESPPDSKDDTSTALQLLAERAQSIARQVQVISHQLHPATLEQLGFVKATQALCEQTARLRGIEVDVQAQVEGLVSDDLGLCLYRILQESLQNATRHGRANQVAVRIQGDGAELHMTVSDNGTGFDPQDTSGSGIGLASMNERARHLGGRLSVQSAPGRGTTIDVRLPRPGTPPDEVRE